MAFLFVIQDYIGYLIGNYQYKFSWFSVSARVLSNLLVLLILTPLIHFTASDLTGKRRGFIGKIVLHAGISLVASFIHRGFSYMIFQLFYSVHAGQSLPDLLAYLMPRSFLVGSISSLIYYWIVAGIFSAAINRKKLIRKERELTNARLHALMTQLQPHFLFNTLNSISSLIDIDKPGAQKMIGRFAELLRGILDNGDQQFVSLEQEIAFIRNYMSIESERFKDRLKVNFTIDPNSEGDKVPTLILQPLVENAIKHGIKSKIENGEINISSRILNGSENPKPYLKLSVRDNGTGLKDGFKFGIGLKNVRNRLEELYPEDYSFEIQDNVDGGCNATIKIPIN